MTMMKKAFATAIALVAFTGAASAQGYVIQVNKADGTTVEHEIQDVQEVRMGTEDWTEYATGTYRYHIWWYDDSGTIPSGLDKENLKMYRSTFNPNRYKIEDWTYYSNMDPETIRDFYFIWDQEAGTVRPEKDQPTGYEYLFAYSELYVEEIVDWAIDWGGIDEDDPDDAYYFEFLPRSYFDAEADTFYFALVYYVGPTPPGNQTLTSLDYETFHITSYAEGAE